MLNIQFFVIFLAAFQASWALDCTQIPDSQVFAGNTVHLPGNYSSPQTIPANFNCIYKITVPAGDSSGIYANVTVFNGIKGVNDFIVVRDITITDYTLNSRRGNGSNTYFVTPGTQITIQVTTKSVFMNSQFLITVEYGNAAYGPVKPMKAGGEMNFLDMSTLRDGQSAFSSVTFYGDEEIFITTALNYRWKDCVFCYVIDGDFIEQGGVYKLTDVAYSGFTTTGKRITVISFEDGNVGLVLNRKSEFKQFNILSAIAVTSYLPDYGEMQYINEGAEVVNFNSTGIIIKDVNIQSLGHCKAHIVSGPPNNSSQFLLDIATATFPHYFDLQYFTIINENCTFGFGVVVA